MISTRGRYALRVMIDLAEQGAEGFTPLKDVALRQGISIKYSEAIMRSLSRAGLVDALHGKGGGYRLNRKASEYSLGEILRVTEGSLAPVACLDESAAPCARAASCKTLPVWERLNALIAEYLDSVSLDSLI